ncbi:DNA repair protein RadA [Alkalilimnicola ehrlichii MLHE-1]|uniref:DNA repair protein RadA n=1 Tax=Alkalilimnicola ehrlichii (strain ATCC BAA-1101 / DSM 17681 / MLHE-1) TaxID=187272 RepID=Q0AB44_ALKEH|nr:DNA repair protein RadA [Alkalilimnicola ehrlichii]ABI55943.1 DNA replication and repair protein RadA [Alkalilimnicola ehrlichii MLHE-1]
MARTKTEFVCTACGGVTPKWQGQCPDCGAWNTLEETTRAPTAPGKGRAGLAARSTVQTLDQVSLEEEARQRTHSTELDRVLGGGLVNGAVVLLGGDPGIGKSTLLLQTLSNLARDHAALYVTGEESLQQVALRASRLGLPRDRLEVLAETSVEAMLATAEARRPRVMVVDSVQTVFTEALQSAPGSVSQVRESAAQLVRYAKRSGTALFLVGHVTKEGALAGPRVLEHMVDTVLYFESDSGSRFRLLRAVKNRFGAANELGVFAMLEEGLKEVRNPSAIFLSRHEEAVPGSLVTVTREGSRPLMVEVQALVADSPLSNPRRVAVGLDGNRLSLLLAVLARHGGVALHGLDVFLNVVGGVRVSETASDLPAVLAVLSSLRDRPLPLDTVVFGELGLSGEIRPVPNGEERLVEAAKHGFRRAVVPRKNRPRKPPEGLEVIGVERLQEAMEAVF